MKDKLTYPTNTYGESYWTTTRRVTPIDITEREAIDMMQLEEFKNTRRKKLSRKKSKER